MCRFERSTINLTFNLQPSTFDPQPMLISFDCPKCLKPARGEVTAASRSVMCTDCGWTKPVADGDVSDGTPTRCLVCGCSDLWRQKDFSPKLGVTIVVIGMSA